MPKQPRKKSFLLLFFKKEVLPFLLLPCLAQAHAQLESANPPVGSTVHTTPSAITLDFSEAVEPNFSHIQVTGPDGKQADRGDLHTAPGLPTRLVLNLGSSAPGTYTVTWHAVSVDTHKTQGRYSFTVGDK